MKGKYGIKVLAVLFGIISGIVTGLGMGGGTILILLLSLFLGQDQHVAQATNLIFFIPTSFAAIIVNIKNKNIDYKITSLIVVFGIIGAVIGALMAQKISSFNLRKIFAVFIIIIAVHEIYDLYKEYRNKRKRHNKNKRDDLI